MKKTILLLAPLLLIACTAKPADVNKALDDMQGQVDAREKARAEAQKLLVDTEDNMDKDHDMDDADKEMMNDEDGQTGMMDKKKEYTAYYDGVVGNGQESVLFFHADWCPKCKENDAKLTAWFAANEYSRSVYKLDYDSNVALRAELGVTSQDTFVLLDGNGNVVKQATFPSEAELTDLLG